MSDLSGSSGAIGLSPTDEMLGDIVGADDSPGTVPWPERDRTIRRLRGFLDELRDQGIDVGAPGEDLETTPPYWRPFIEDFFRRAPRRRKDVTPTRSLDRNIGFRSSSRLSPDNFADDRRTAGNILPDESHPFADESRIAGHILPAGFASAGVQQIPPVPVREVQRRVARRMDAEWARLEYENDIEKLRTWIANNIGYVLKHHVMYDQLVRLVRHYATEEQKQLLEGESLEDPELYVHLLDIIWTLLDHCKQQYALIGQVQPVEEVLDWGGIASAPQSSPVPQPLPGPSTALVPLPGPSTALEPLTPRMGARRKIKKKISKGVKKAKSFFGSPRGPRSPDTPGVRRAVTSPEYYDEYADQYGGRYAIADTPPRISPPSRRPSPLSQTFVLTSPKREEPLFVNIDVEPSNLIDTVQGEAFVCDIKLDVQPGGQLPLLQEASGGVSPYESDTSPDRSLEMSGSPIIKGRYRGRRGVPPEITPTSTRRKYGLFTPKGIFKRGQLNIRRIPGKHPISELPWSPTYLPEDARSPITSLASPLRWSDRSVSWEREYESDYGSSPSSSPVIRRPAYGYHSPDFLLSSSSPSYRYTSPRSDDLTYSSPIIQRTSYRGRSPRSDDLTYYSPVIQRSSYRGRSPRSDDLTYSSPVIQRSSYRGRSPRSDDLTYSSPSYRRRSPRSDDLTYSSPAYVERTMDSPGSDDLTYYSPTY